MDYHHKTLIGIIEGFFGRSWDWEHRAQYANFLSINRCDFYIYAPKSDRHLRATWQIDWPKTEKHELQKLRAIYSAAGVQFGIGLSPHEMYLNHTTQELQKFKQRIKQINELQPDILCILFDDMRGDIPQLAKLQTDIVHSAAEISTAQRIICCPTYYSFDPVLEKVFGEMPQNYWKYFAQRLDPHIDLFWTGEKVCSTDYSATHLAEIQDLLGRKPFLWDNYPVNDGAIKSNILQLRPFNQSHSELANKLAGHAVNPMNQPWLSQIPISSLGLAYHRSATYDPVIAFDKICVNLCGQTLGLQLQKDIRHLQDDGLKKLSLSQQQTLRNTYKQFLPNPYAQEIIEWLDGKWTFDPACLTE